MIMLLISFHFYSFSNDQHIVDSLQLLLKRAKQDTVRANILYQISVAYWGVDPDKAIDYANQTLTLSEKAEYKKRIGDAYNSLGVVNTDKGDYTLATEFLLKAIKICEEIDDKPGIAKTSLNYGAILKDQGKYTEAI